MDDKQNYNGLVEKTREEIIKELGQGFNYYQNEVWTFNLKKNWLGRWKYLYLYFKDDKVIKIHIGH